MIYLINTENSCCHVIHRCSVIPTGSSCVPENPSRIAPCPRNTCNPCAKDKNVNDGGGTYPVLNPCECGQPNCVPMQTLVSFIAGSIIFSVLFSNEMFRQL